MPDPIEPQAEQSEGKSRVQARIDQLTARNTESQNFATAETARADALAAQNASLLQQIQQSQTQPRPVQAPALGAPNDPLAQFIGVNVPQKQTAEAPATPDFEAIIAATVEKAIAPFVQLEQARSQESALHAQQSASFDNALGFMPNLGTAGSMEQELFDAILANQPELRQLGNAPLLVANMVSGVLAAGGQSPQQQETRKIAASPPNPAGGFDLSARLQDVAGPGDQVAKNANLRDAIITKGKTTATGGDGSGLSNSELEAYIGLAMGRANAE